MKIKVSEWNKLSKSEKHIKIVQARAASYYKAINQMKLSL